MKIKDAIFEVLKKENKPLSVKEIYLQIVENQLYNFKSDNPEHIVRTLLRRQSENINFPSSRKVKYLYFLRMELFGLKIKLISLSKRIKIYLKKNYHTTK